MEQLPDGITVRHERPSSHQRFYEIVSGFMEKAELDDIMPIIRVRPQESTLLLTAIILGCLRRNDHTSVLVYASYDLVNRAAKVFIALLDRLGGKCFKLKTLERTCIAIRFRVHDLRRNVVLGIPAIYESPYISLFAFNFLHDPIELLPDDRDPIVVIAVARGMEKTEIKTAELAQIGVEELLV